MRVFVVWEPILATDFMPPSRGTLQRISDSRVQQYWDEDHVLAKRMAKDARPPQPKPECCENDGILWDLVAVYAKGAKWEATLPPAIMFDGPVVQLSKEIDVALRTSGNATIRGAGAQGL